MISDFVRLTLPCHIRKAVSVTISRNDVEVAQNIARFPAPDTDESATCEPSSS